MIWWIKIVITILLILIAFTVFLFFSARHKKQKTIKMVEKMFDTASVEKRGPVHLDSLMNLPKPVLKYFRNVLSKGQTVIQNR